MFKYLHYMNIVTIKLLYKVPILGGELYTPMHQSFIQVYIDFEKLWLNAVSSEISHKFAF